MSINKNSKFQLTASDIHEYENGESVASIATRKQVSKPTIINHLRKAGVEIKNIHKKFQPIPEDIIAYKNGESIASIAKNRGVDPETVRSSFKKAGIKVQRRKRKIQLTPTDINAYCNGETLSSMSLRLKMNVKTIKKGLNDAGIKIRKNSEVKKDRSHLVKHQYKSSYELSKKDIFDYQRGTSAFAIGQRYNVSSTSVIRKLQRANIRTRTRSESMDLLY